MRGLNIERGKENTDQITIMDVRRTKSRTMNLVFRVFLLACGVNIALTCEVDKLASCTSRYNTAQVRLLAQVATGSKTDEAAQKETCKHLARLKVCAKSLMKDCSDNHTKGVQQAFRLANKKPYNCNIQPPQSGQSTAISATATVVVSVSFIVAVIFY